MIRKLQGKGLTEEVQACIDECLNCAGTCLQTASYGAEKGGEHAQADHLRLLYDCAEICQTAANFMLRGSEWHSRACAVCADLCARCAEDCARFQDDEMMAACAEACRTCAESCRRMAGQSMSR